MAHPLQLRGPFDEPYHVELVDPGKRYWILTPS